MFVAAVSWHNNINDMCVFSLEPSPVMLEAMDTYSVQSSNISWSSRPLLVDPKPNQMYTLSVTSPSTREQMFVLYEPYYLFTAPEGAPPCEVYNFSVTATYVGATYTGARSFVDLGGQEMSLNENGLYNLQKVSIEGGPITLRLLINDTERNNQTVVNCIAENQVILKTTLFIYGMSINSSVTITVIVYQVQF